MTEKVKLNIKMMVIYCIRLVLELFKINNI